MEMKEVSGVLGRLSTDARVVATMAAFAIDEQPRVRIIDSDAQGPIYATDDWLLNSVRGIEFGFEDEAAFFGLDASEHGSGSMVLTQIYMYGLHAGVKPYALPMPLDLKVTDDRATVRAKLSSFEKKRRSYIRDTWEFESFTLVVSYTEGDAAIDFVLCLLSQPSLAPLYPRAERVPSLKDIISLFGKGWKDPALRALLDTLELDRQGEGRGGPLATFRRAHGFDLHFHPPGFLERAPARAVYGPVFSEIVFFRDRVFDARRWSGQLPFGLLFEDSPEQVVEKVGRPPNDRLDEDFAGWVLWHFEEFSLQVHYSSMENFVLNVRVMAPGIWAALQAA